MKFLRILVILSLVVGASAGILFFSFFTLPQQSEYILPHLFIVRNTDLNQTHSVKVQVANVSGTNLFGGTYNLDPGNSTVAEISAPDHNVDLFFSVLVDGYNGSEMLLNMSPTHIAVIEIGSPDDPYPVSFSVIDVTPKKI
jgi:hypothetical protein